jgi:two-component system, NtrC family, response regulator HydG
MKDPLGKILIVDDDEDILISAQLFLEHQKYVVHTATNPHKIPALLQEHAFDLILLDMNFAEDTTSGAEGLYWLQRILEIDPQAVVVCITAFGDIDLSVKAIKQGAADFVLKPWHNEKLLATINLALKLRKSTEQVELLRTQQRQLMADTDHRYQEIIGKSHVMQDVFATIEKVAATDANVLILGENGTGKELVARALHRRSQRASKLFLSVDMGALTESLFESELFGHVKGAFTDAKNTRIGRFETACGGTLFLDEIGNLSLPLQGKLLKVLEERQVIPVGSNTPKPIDMRLICATNAPLPEKVQRQQFRQDLFYRINTITIHLPPLRERREDIPLLIDHFTALYVQKYQKSLRKVSPATLEKLSTYHWPGNIRELRHAVERAVIMSDTDTLLPKDFLFALPSDATATGSDGVVLQDFNLDHVEKLVVHTVLKKHHGNISKAAEELGLNRASLYRRLEKYGI